MKVYPESIYTCPNPPAEPSKNLGVCLFEVRRKKQFKGGKGQGSLVGCRSLTRATILLPLV